MNRYFIAFFIASLFVVPGLTGTSQTKECHNYRLLSPGDFYIRLHSSVMPLILDTRTPQEYRKYRIPHALLADSVATLKKLCDSLDKEQDVFIYCETEQRSMTAAGVLAGMGFKNIYVLKGGVLAWKSAGFPVDNKRIKKSREQNNKTPFIKGKKKK